MRAFIVAVLSTAMLSFFRTVLVEAASPPNPSQNLAITATAPGTNIDGLKFICDPPYGGDAGYVYLGSEATIFSFRSLQTTSGFVTVFIAIISDSSILYVGPASSGEIVAAPGGVSSSTLDTQAITNAPNGTSLVVSSNYGGFMACPSNITGTYEVFVDNAPGGTTPDVPTGRVEDCERFVPHLSPYS